MRVSLLCIFALAVFPCFFGRLCAVKVDWIQLLLAYCFMELICKSVSGPDDEGTWYTVGFDCKKLHVL